MRGLGGTKRNARPHNSPREFTDEEIQSSRNLGGRYSTYLPEYAETARRLIRIGATRQQLAEFIGVSPETLLYWAYQNPEFLAAIKVGREDYDDNITHSLARRALGYDYDSEKVYLTKDGDVVRVPIVVHVPPETTAIIFWLCNRHPDVWKRNRDPVPMLPGSEAPTMRIQVENSPDVTTSSGGEAVTIDDHASPEDEASEK